MFYTIANLIQIKAPEMKPKCTKGQWLVRLTMLLIFFTILRNYGVSSAPISNQSKFTSSEKKNFTNLDDQNSKDDFKMEKEMGLNSKIKTESGGMDYDKYACIQLYGADRFPKGMSFKDYPGSKIYLNSIDQDSEVDKCLKAVKFLRSTCPTFDDLKSLERVNMDEWSEEMEGEKYGGTDEFLNHLATDDVGSYSCFLRHCQKETWYKEWVNCGFEARLNSPKLEDLYQAQDDFEMDLRKERWMSGLFFFAIAVFVILIFSALYLGMLRPNGS